MSDKNISKSNHNNELDLSFGFKNVLSLTLTPNNKMQNTIKNQFDNLFNGCPSETMILDWYFILDKLDCSDSNVGCYMDIYVECIKESGETLNNKARLYFGNCNKEKMKDILIKMAGSL